MKTKPSIDGGKGRGTVERRLTGVRRISSAEILAGHREVVIDHGEDEYRLRLTASAKLILTK